MIREFLKIYTPLTDEQLQRLAEAVQKEEGGPMGFLRRWSKYIGSNIKDGIIAGSYKVMIAGGGQPDCVKLGEIGAALRMKSDRVQIVLQKIRTKTP